jgi:hypothetical protein
MATRLGTQVLTWAGTLIVARKLHPYDFGLMTTGMIFVGLADMLAEAGVSKALVLKNTREPRDLAEGFTLSLILSTALALEQGLDRLRGHLRRKERKLPVLSDVPIPWVAEVCLNQMAHASKEPIGAMKPRDPR